jgi:fructokinase
MIIGALEGGGTKMVCAVGNEKGEISERISIPTETPDKTMPAMIRFFQEKKPDALGIAFFGPLDLNRESPSYGSVTTTPKPGWQNYQVVGEFEKALHIPIGFDTDVNGSMLGEATWGAAKNLQNAVYFTIGTGIGAGIMANGKMLHGMLHPEGGHILLSRHPDDRYRGHCPFHPNCLEGLASGPAIEERWGKKAFELSDRTEVWELEAFYIGQALVDVILMLSPQLIILGGGVMHQEQVMPLIRSEVKKQMNGYIVTREMQDLDHYIILPTLKDNQGILGALKLGMNEYSLKTGV